MKRQNIWFTSDTHFWHSNIIKFCNRQDPESNKAFSGVDAMNEHLINNWNNVVGKTDLVYHLGDFSYRCNGAKSKELIERLNGRKCLIRGNHDAGIKSLEYMFEWVKDMAEIKVEDDDLPGYFNGFQPIVLCHYPLRTWNKARYGAWHLFGHCHGTLDPYPQGLSLDVGIDSHNLSPVSYESIKQTMLSRSFTQLRYDNAIVEE